MTDSISRLSNALADRYRIERELGQGGMATVFLAEDLKHQRKVAIKVLKPDLAAVLGAERFVQEITTTAGLQHPHILPLFDSGTADGFLYYVMPYIDGETVRDKLNRETQFGIEEAIRITTEVADALDYAHRHGVIHRDIKPENILLHDGRPMVMDFGIALAVSAAAGGRMTETGLSLGTPYYMSPEQATADKQITARSDIYSLASVLYEMLAGEPPHMGNSAQQIIMKIIAEPVAEVTTRRRAVPPNVAAALAKALEKLPADRFGSASEFAKGLANPVFTHSATAGTAAALRRPAASTRLVSALAAIAVVATAIAVWGWTRRLEPAPTQPTRFFYSADSTHVLGTLCCGPLYAISRDGRRFAYTGSILGRAEVFIREMDALVATHLPDTRGGTSLFFSPDGKWLGFANQQGTIFKVAVSGGTPVPVVTTGDHIYGATWTDRNTIVYASSAPRQGLWSVPADGGEPKLLIGPDSASGQVVFATPWAVPGTNRILFTTWRRSEEPLVVMIDLDSPDPATVTRGLHPQMTESGHLVVALPGGSIAAQAFDARTNKTSGPVEYLANDLYISSNGWSDFAMSLSGTLLYRLGGAHPRVALARADGSARALRIPLEGVLHYDNPRFAPGDRHLGITGSTEGGHRVFLVDLERGSVLPVTLDGDSEHFDWTDDGDSLIVAYDYRELVIYPAGRGGERSVVLPAVDSADAGGEIGRVSVSGPWVAFTYTTPLESGDGGRNVEILVLRRGGEMRAQPFTTTRYREYSPAIAPDGRWMAYVSDETGRDEVYVTSFPTPGDRQSVSLDGGAEPVWAADGRTLYFRDQAGAVSAVRVRMEGARLVVDRPERLGIEGYEVSPDADYDVSSGTAEFAVIEARSSGTRIVVVLNALSAMGSGPR